MFFSFAKAHIADPCSDIDETTPTEIPFVFRNTVVSMIGVEFPLSFPFFKGGRRGRGGGGGGDCITAKKVDNICILSPMTVTSVSGSCWISHTVPPALSLIAR